MAHGILLPVLVILKPELTPEDPRLPVHNISVKHLHSDILNTYIKEIKHANIQ